MATIKTMDEFAVVCESHFVPAGLRSEPGWRLLMVDDLLDFSLVGILANLSTTLANVGVSIFVISTYNTDYFLVKQDQLEIAIDALRKAGHTINEVVH